MILIFLIRYRWLLDGGYHDCSIYCTLLCEYMRLAFDTFCFFLVSLNIFFFFIFFQLVYELYVTGFAGFEPLGLKFGEPQKIAVRWGSSMKFVKMPVCRCCVVSTVCMPRALPPQIRLSWVMLMPVLSSIFAATSLVTARYLGFMFFVIYKCSIKIQSILYHGMFIMLFFP